jgi:hypothetical protein
MKKLFSLMIVCLFSLVLSFGSAFATCQNCDQPGEAQAIGQYNVGAWSYDDTVAFKGDMFGGGTAWGHAEGMVGGWLNTYAHSLSSYEWTIEWVKGKWGYYPKLVKEYVPAFAYEAGFVCAGSEVDTWAWVKNSPFKVKAGAGARFVDGYVFMGGTAIGNEGNRERIESGITYAGNFGQSNTVFKTVGHSFVGAGNYSGITFQAYMPERVVTGRDAVVFVDGTTYTPDVVTTGMSSVSIDAFGAFRSISGHTENMARVEFSPCHKPATLISNVYGYGSTGGIVQGTGANYAGGTAMFNYNGYTQGAGEANFRATVSNVGNTATATAMGSSWATANGNPTGNCQPK